MPAFFVILFILGDYVHDTGVCFPWNTAFSLAKVLLKFPHSHQPIGKAWQLGDGLTVWGAVLIHYQAHLRTGGQNRVGMKITDKIECGSRPA